jgi:hypothetical protein
MVGAGRKMLGVVVRDNRPDIMVSEEGRVSPGTGGMSVAPDWRLLPHYRIPKRLRQFAPDATGSDQYCCWRMGDGPFTDAPLTDHLSLRQDAPDHGIVEPSRHMLIDEYQSCLAATRDLWTIIEEDKP